ncbi:MAG: glycosyltransferase [Oscillatoriaceae bacterium SKW80]|nr:glycosyltransferase [Oscillatoriaceae bacterium SKYG93]MCX8122118.1 glycosyltransferase [Oscillatoriaceae bacterium SKW80]MDW8454405.1 glycosyltransferase family 2 protein [Oscillatoriaceae cyanobacterium SKYGB_i_bin93]HIK29269.1 glycosyltransferase family 2 protein [Oscillatoriaceae cyanobacterium M7585_C2015_266]
MISIIIPTFNREKYLIRALASLGAQNFSPDKFEILILDNNSTDGTKTASEKFIARNNRHQIRYILETEPGLLSGRHRGALEAQGDILIFIDDDIEADVNWLQALADSFTDTTVQLVGGRNLPKYEIEPPKWIEWFWCPHPYGRFCGYLSLLDFGSEIREISANYVWGLNFSIRKKALFELGGFHPDCLPSHLQHFQGDGETGLTRQANKLGYRAIYQPRALVFHHITKERLTPEYFEKRFFYQGICDSYTQIRESQGKLNKKNLQERVKAALLGLKDTLLIASGRIKLSEKQKLHRKFNKAYRKGYEFHQSAVRNNPKLLEWVLKKDYWDYTLPQL